MFTSSENVKTDDTEVEANEQMMRSVGGEKGGMESDGGMRGLPAVSQKPPPAAVYNYPAVTTIFNSSSLHRTWTLQPGALGFHSSFSQGGRSPVNMATVQ